MSCMPSPWAGRKGSIRNFIRYPVIGGFLLVGTAMLTGCTVIPARTSSTEAYHLFRTRELALYHHGQWLMSGRVAVQKGEDGWHANLRWRQLADRFDIMLSAPLGQGTLHLLGDLNGVELETQDQAAQYAARPEDLLHDRLGWSIPLSGMRYWVLGLPAPDSEPEMVWDEGGRVISLKQSGWNIAYRRYTQVNGLYLPDKIYMDNSQLKVRLVIDSWELEQG